jgi:hypothetical protein
MHTSLGELRQRWKPFSHAEINRLDPLPDVADVTGDLVDRGIGALSSGAAIL